MMQNEENTNAGGWDSEREKALTAREKALAEREAAMIEKGLVEAFTRAGGRQAAVWDDPNEATPFAAIKGLLKDKIVFTSSGLIIKDEKHPNGNVKTLDDKLKELKSTQISAFLFSNTETQQQQQTQQTQLQPTKPTFTREQARKGKADIDAIARGDADIK
jgi:hypothetical protein